MKVSVKSIPVRYDGDRYLKGETLDIKEKYFNDELFEEIEESNELINLFDLSPDELKKVNKDVIKAFLDKEEIVYDSNANKDILLKIILGEDQDEQSK